MASILVGEFSYSYSCRGDSRQLAASIPIPYKGSVRELAVRLMSSHKCPCYVENELTQCLGRFIREQTAQLKDTIGDEVILKAFQEESIDKQVNHWVSKYTQNHAHFTTLKDVPDDPFPSVYHQLINSSAFTTLLQLEHTYSISMNEIHTASKNAMTVMQKKHDEELEKMMHQLSTQQKTNTDVNKLMRQHVTDSKTLEDKWVQEINRNQDLQRREYRDWLSRVHEEMKEDDTKKQKGKRKSALSELQSQQATLMLDEGGLSDSQPLMEESFTIHLGAQQKSSHNLRLICGDVLLFCSDSGGKESQLEKGNMSLNPRRIETAMSLYTDKLTALILMTDTEINTISGLKEIFADLCRRSTDFHFSSIDDQLSAVQQFATQVREMREDGTLEQLNEQSQKSTPTKTPERSRDSSPKMDRTPVRGNVSPNWPQGNSFQSLPMEEGVMLDPGDFYITRHSNLSQVHVVCHLVSEETAILNSSLSTRHPIMLGLRNALRTVARHGFHSVILPLLLTNQMKPDMTINWCLRRAELVFKSIKGFLLENTTWQGNQAWNVQFLLPEGISQDLFEQISDLLSKTYRTSISLNLSSRIVK